MPIEPQPPSAIPAGGNSISARSPSGPRHAEMPLWKKIAQRLALLALLAASFAVLAIPLNVMAKDYLVDFTNFYVGGKIVRDGQVNQLYDAGLQQKLEQQVAPAGGVFQPYLHPPFEALLFAFVASFSYPHAFLLWAGMNLLVLALLVYLLKFTGLRLTTGAYGIWMALCLVLMLLTLGLGQDALLLALVFLGTFLALKRRWDYLAGLVLGLGLYRFQILLPFAFVFLLRRRWKLFAGFTTMGLAELLISAAMVGWAGLVHYLEVLVKVGGTSAGPWVDPTATVQAMPSLHGAFNTLLGSVLPHKLLFLSVFVATLFLLGWAAWEFKSLDHPEDPAFNLEFCLATIAALLASYHVFFSELSPLLVAGFLMLAYEAARKRKGAFGNRHGSLLFVVFLGLFVAGAVARFPIFSLEVIPMLGMMVWLSRELSTLRKPAATS
jgi:hypothetical protein